MMGRLKKINNRMEQKHIDNIGQLKSFVQEHDLQDRHSVIQFEAIVTIKTAKRRIISDKMKIWIPFDDGGSVRILASEASLDPHLFPTVFLAQYPKIEHVDHEYLLISDTHTRNAEIGKYEVKIIPQRRLRE
jgi:hypothetical protein